MISHYVGSEKPTLSKMGGSDWAKTKSRARKAVKEIAADLIKLYSARQKRSISGWVTVTGPPEAIWRLKMGMTLPFEPSTLPKRTAANTVFDS